MLLFQFPGIAERWLTEDDWANFRSWGAAPRRRSGDLRPGGERLAHPRPYLYRANVRPESLVRLLVRLPPVQAPTMGVWSTGDGALAEVQMTDSAITWRARGGTSAWTALVTGCS